MQEKITSLKNDLKALQSTEKSQEVQNIENEIKALQAQIVALQNQLKALQSAEKSDQIKNLENEIRSLQNKLISRQNDLKTLQRELSELDGGYDKQTLIGHIDYLKIGATELEADFSVTDPISTGELKNAVGVISAIQWNGGYAEPISFSGQISDSNKEKIAAMMNEISANTKVEFILSAYDYDRNTKSYYKCFHSDSIKLKGLVFKQGGGLAMYISMDESYEVTSPKNFTFSLGVMPQEPSQDVHIAVSSNSKLVKKWGVQAGK